MQDLWIVSGVAADIPESAWPPSGPSRASRTSRAVNLSLGTDSTQTYHLGPLNAAVERAWDSGIVVTVSSSNNGPGAGTESADVEEAIRLGHQRVVTGLRGPGGPERRDGARG